MRKQLKILPNILLAILITATSYAKPLPKVSFQNSPLSWMLAYPNEQQQTYYPLLLAAQLDENTTLATKLQGILGTYKKMYSNSKSELAFVKLVFSQLHRKELKIYREYTGIGSLLAYGEYNCVSASALYGIIFNELGFKVRYLEIPNHVCLLLTLSDGSHVMLEATDPISGFIAGQDEINARVNQLYTKALAQEAIGAKFRVIGLKQLIGLTYYNQAAWHANHGNSVTATKFISVGEQWYPAYRFRKVKRILAAR